MPFTHVITNDKSFFNFGITTLAAGLLTLLPVTFSHAEDISDNHSSGETIDPSAKINALDVLTSVKDPAKLSLTLPSIEHFTTDNGVPVAFVSTDALPIVDVNIRFNAGSARDSAIRADGFGIANMTAAMLSQGTQAYDENEFNRQVELLGIELDSAAYKDMFIVSLRSLSDDEHLTPALQIFKEVLTQPRFDTEVLERNKARLMVGLQQQQQDPSSLAAIAFSEALYKDHPYAHQSTGTLDSVPSLTIADLKRFQAQFLVAANANMSITGDLSLDEAKSLANELTAGLATGTAAATLPEPMPLTEQTRIHIPFESTQTTVIMGQLGTERSSTPAAMQESIDFAIGNDILAGGDFNARLMKEVRINRGYTYGISGGMTPMQAKGPYRISFSTRNDKAVDAIDTTLATINETLSEGVTSDEVALTKENFTNSFPMSFASNAGINGTLGMMGFYDLPDSYLSGYLNRIDQTNTRSVNQALTQTIDPSKFLIVTVGAQDTDETNPAEQADSE